MTVWAGVRVLVIVVAVLAPMAFWMRIALVLSFAGLWVVLDEWLRAGKRSTGL